MKKKILIPIITAGIALFSAISANAQDMNMYINNQFVVRDMQTMGDFDMLPILNIAGELGFNCTVDGTVIKLYNDNQSFTFTMGDASVYDQDGKWYGLDVVPQIINGQVRVPAKFFQDAMGMSYVWDSVTNTIFMGSENTYEWLIGTEEYKFAANISKYNGTWYYTPSGDYRPLVKLNISESNTDYIIAQAYRTHGKGSEYKIGRANFINSNTAVAYGTFEWAHVGFKAYKKYEFIFYSNYIQMNMYDSDGNYENSYNFYR